MSEINTRPVYLLPYIIDAVAMSPAATETINRLYEENRSECQKALAETPFRIHPAINKGKVKDVVLHMRALGYVCAAKGEEEQAKRILVLLRAAERKLCKYIEDNVSLDNSDEDNDRYIFSPMRSDYVDTDVLFRKTIISIAAGIYKGYRSSSPIMQDMLDKIDIMSNQSSDVMPDKELWQKAKALLRHSGEITGSEFLYSLMSGDYDGIGAISLISELAGVSVTEYCSGVRIPRIVAECAMIPTTDVSPQVLMLIGFMMTAVAEDRKYCLSTDADLIGTESEKAREAAREAERRERQSQGELARCREDQAAIVSELDAAKREIAKLQATIKSMESDAQEVADLRRAIYEAVQQDNEIVNLLPRAIPDGTVCVGGSDTWRRSMATEIPEVTWYSGDVSIAPDVIRSAPEMWIQVSFLPHSRFYAAINIAKAAGTPIRYFSRTGVRSCVAEIEREEDSQ